MAENKWVSEVVTLPFNRFFGFSPSCRVIHLSFSHTRSTYKPPPTNPTKLGLCFPGQENGDSAGESHSGNAINARVFVKHWAFNPSVCWPEDSTNGYKQPKMMLTQQHHEAKLQDFSVPSQFLVGFHVYILGGSKSKVNLWMRCGLDNSSFTTTSRVFAKKILESVEV